MRSTMLDDWFASLMVLASEKDLLNNISVDNIINEDDNLMIENRMHTKARLIKI